jgi:Zn-dependent protease
VTKLPEAFLEISKFKGQIALTEKKVYIGKDELARSAQIPFDLEILNSVSSVRRSKSGKVVKYHFLISFKKDHWEIEDSMSTNGTFVQGRNLKGAGRVILKDGAEIIVPIDEQGRKMQLKIIFRLHSSTDQNAQIGGGKRQFYDPTQDSTVAPISKNNLSKYQDPTLNPTVSPTPTAGGAEYFDPTSDPTIAPPTIPAVTNTAYNMGSGGVPDYSSSRSFILVRQKIPMPPNAFDPQVGSDYGLDMSMFYRMDKPEWWHITVAYWLLAFMIYHTNVNLMLITTLIYQLPLQDYLTEIFLDPIPAALIFGIVFLVHELSHLNTGKKQGFQSRFCLISKGVKITSLAALIGFPIALPGAAVSLGVDPQTDTDKMGAIKTAGPMSNLIFGIICLIGGVILSLTTNSIVTQWVLQGAIFNFTLGLFNMIPKEFGTLALDGKFIFGWKRRLYFIILLLLLAGYVVTFFFLQPN